jgi:type I restriction enzyme M protein
MLPLIVLRRFDWVLAENKQKVLDEKKRLEQQGITSPALEKSLSRIAATDRKQELFNTSGFTFETLLGDAPNIAGNLMAYIQGFSPRARDIFDKFEFEAEIAKLDEANRLYLILKEFCASDINLSPKAISNLQMGYLFEELARKFNAQANEEAGDHFTPREINWRAFATCMALCPKSCRTRPGTMKSSIPMRAFCSPSCPTPQTVARCGWMTTLS